MYFYLSIYLNKCLSQSLSGSYAVSFNELTGQALNIKSCLHVLFIAYTLGYIANSLEYIII